MVNFSYDRTALSCQGETPPDTVQSYGTSNGCLADWAAEPLLVEPERVAYGLSVLQAPGQVCEVRALNARAYPNSRPNTFSGYFDDPNALVHELQRLCDFTGVYVTLNPVEPALLCRCSNRLEYARQNSSTGDKDIRKRNWLLIDIDPVRPSGISATDEEVEGATELVVQVIEFLSDRGWPGPVCCFSGNGWHLLYRIDLPRDDGGLVKRCLQVVDAELSNEKAKIDTSVHNPARICRLYGTSACKGDNNPQAGRVHRMSYVFPRSDQVPWGGFEEVQVVDRALLEALAAEADALDAEANGRSSSPRRNRSGCGQFDLEAFIRRHELRVTDPADWGGEQGQGQVWRLTESPLCDHGGDGPYIIRHASGAITAGCAHDSCSWTWHDLRGLFEPQDSTHAGKMITADDDAERLAQQFLDTHYGHEICCQLIHHNGEWLVYRNGGYYPLPKDELRGELRRFIHRRFQEEAAAINADPDRDGLQPVVANSVSQKTVSNTVDALISLCILPGDNHLPFWRDVGSADERRNRPPAGQLVVMRNGLLHLGGEENTLMPLTPAYVSRIVLDYECDPAAQCPHWEAFLVSLWGDDLESVRLLQEWFGYCLTGDTSHQKLLMLIGPPRSGKGTIQQVLTGLVGPDNVASPTLGSLAEQFGLAGLVDKSLAIFPDARLTGRNDRGGIVERLLSISGGDRQDVQRKYLPTLANAQLRLKLFITSNELPSLRETSGALLSRVLALQTHESFLGREDHGLQRRLLSERSGILNWSIKGLARLRDHGRFTQPESAGELLAGMDELSSPTRQFVSTCCLTGSDHRVAVSVLFDAYRAWCVHEGIQYTPTLSQFGRDLHASVPGLRTQRPREGQERIRRYVGIGLRPDCGTAMPLLGG